MIERTFNGCAFWTCGTLRNHIFDLLHLSGLQRLPGWASRLIEAAGLPAEALTDPNLTISYIGFASLMELVASELHLPNFGLQHAQMMEPEFPNVGPIVFLSKFASTLEEWLRLAMKYWIHHTNAFTLELIADPAGEVTRLRYIAVPGFYPSRQLIENAMANVVTLCRNATGLRARNPVAVRFRHRRPADTSVHEAIFRCPLEFDSLHDEFIVENEVLALPIAGNLKYFRALVDVYMKARGVLLPTVESPMETSVALVISSVIGTGKCNIEEVSALLGVGTKKLQRLLADENTSFSDILDRAREQTAIQLLARSDIPIANIAGLLDYSSPSAFILAFKRWSDVTPLAFRKAKQAEMEQSGDFLNDAPGS